MKATCLLTDSMYSLAVSANGGIGARNRTLGLAFDGIGEVVGGDGTIGAGSMGRGGVSVVSIGTESCPSRVGTNSGTGVEVGSGTGLAPLPERGWAILAEVGLPQTSWHPTRGLAFLRILPNLGSS